MAIEFEIDALTLKYLKGIAKARTEAHKGQKSTRKLTNDYELKGVIGEWASGELFNIPPDFDIKKGGDNGKDGEVCLVMDNGQVRTFSYDAKTIEPWHRYLAHEVGKPMSNLFILVEYDKGKNCARVTGWEWGCVLRETEPDQLLDDGPLSYRLDKKDLRPIEELLARLKNEIGNMKDAA